MRRLLGVPNTDSTRRILDVWGFTFVIEYMESLISINYSQVRDEVIGHTRICFGMFGLPFFFGGGVRGVQSKKSNNEVSFAIWTS